MNRFRQRRGFTLVEMLVVMGIIVLITAGAMLVVPAALNRDRSTDAVTSLRGWLEIAQARAARDGAPRGLRLIVDTVTPNQDPLHVTEVQYIESPPVLVFNSNPPYPNGFTPTFQPSPLTPRVEFLYTAPPPGTVTNRQCFLKGLTREQATLMIDSTTNVGRPTLWMPVLGTWHRIFRTLPATPSLLVPVTTSPESFDIEVVLSDPSDLSSGYPDTQLGATTHYVTHHFGIYAPPRPLLGEPTMQLPTNTCVDLYANVSSPAGNAGSDYDILFAPSGSLAFTTSINGDGHVFLCVRDPRRGSPMNLSTTQVREGGEMMILGIKARSGAIAVQPVDININGLGVNPDPYSFARQSVSGQ